MKPSIAMTEAELEREIDRLTTKIARVMQPADHGLTGSVLTNLLGMYLWTFPRDKREAMAGRIIAVAFELVDQRTSPQAPPDVRAPLDG